MPIVSVLIVILIIGVLVWAIEYIPWIDPTFKQIVRVVAVIGTVIWLLSLFLPISHVENIRLGRT